MRRSLRGAALLGSIVALATWVAPLRGLAQDDPATSPVCVLSVDEMADLSGLPITGREAAGLECAYSADPAVRPVQVIVSVIPPDPDVSDSADDPLRFLRFDHEDGTDTTVAGMPAWVAQDGTWVDLGGDVLAVWLNVVFDAAPPPMPETAVAIAEAVVPRYVANPRPSAPPRSAAGGVVARFPEEVAGQRLDLTTLPAPDLFSLLAVFSPGDATLGIAQLQDAITSMGVAPADVEGATGDIFDFDAGVTLSISAVQIPGQDVSTLLEPAVMAFADWDGASPEPVTIAGRDLVHVAEPPGGMDGNAWFLADGEVLWILSGDQVLVEALLGALPAAGSPGA